MNPKQLDDGGPAFPYSVQRLQSSYHQEIKGMSLRDWFAGMALQGILANPNINPMEVGDVVVQELTNFFADAMLSARKDER